MVKLVMVAGLVAVACGASKETDEKLDKLARDLANEKEERRDLEKKVETLTAELSRGKDLERKIDDLQRKVDLVRAAPPPVARRPEPDRAKTYAIPVGDAPMMDGPADAKVTIVEAYDYACPYCEKSRDTLVELRRRYGNDLRVVYRPYIVHPQIATAAAYASCAAARQHKFAAMDRALWEQGFKARQFDKPSCYTSPDGCPIIEGFARTIGLDRGRFKLDLLACENPVQDGMRELSKFGIGATPSFFINGRFLSGAMPVENFATLIDEELAKANARIQSGSSRGRYYDEWVIGHGETSL